MDVIDVRRIQQALDCREVVQRDLGQPRHAGRSAWTWRCPLHGEQHGASLAVWPDGWQCFGRCATGGDVIGWVMRYRGLGFREAVDELASLNGAVTLETTPSCRPSAPVQRLPQPPPLLWQAQATAVVAAAQARLWSDDGVNARRYLREQRGLKDETMIEAKLGYVPGHYREYREMEGLKVPCGILLPVEWDGCLWQVEARRAAGERKYENVAGSVQALYPVHPGVAAPVLVTEGKFDALLAAQVARQPLRGLSLPSASCSRYWLDMLALEASAAPLAVCVDHDAAGEAVLRKMRQRFQPSAFFVPAGKDLTEFYLAAGEATFAVWLDDVLAQAFEAAG